MEGYSRKDPQLELRLAPPGEEEEWTLNYSSKNSSSLWQNQSNSHFLSLQQQEQEPEKKVSANTNTAQKRNACGPVVGWPPVRSFRKNLASGNSSESQQVVPNKVPNEKPVENCSKLGLFVKINMDGVPIGRKLDLKSCDSSYLKLSFVVNQLFKGLLAAQNGEKEVIIGGLLDGSGDYTLVYEDNEGDRILVGDVPWHMFISTVKRLRVLKSSELPTLSRVSKQGKQCLALD